MRFKDYLGGFLHKIDQSMQFFTVFRENALSLHLKFL